MTIEGKPRNLREFTPISKGMMMAMMMMMIVMTMMNTFGFFHQTPRSRRQRGGGGGRTGSAATCPDERLFRRKPSNASAFSSNKSQPRGETSFSMLSLAPTSKPKGEQSSLKLFLSNREISFLTPSCAHTRLCKGEQLSL